MQYSARREGDRLAYKMPGNRIKLRRGFYAGEVRLEISPELSGVTPRRPLNSETAGKQTEGRMIQIK